MAKKSATAAVVEMEDMNAAETTSTKRTMTPEEKAARKTAKKAAKKAASAVVRDFLASAEGKEWATAAGDFGQALLTLFPGRPVAASEGKATAQREAAKCVLVFGYIAEHGTVTDLEMFQEFKVGVAETRKLIRDVTKKAEKAGETLSVFIRRTEDGEGWEAIQAEPAVSAEAGAPAAE